MQKERYKERKREGKKMSEMDRIRWVLRERYKERKRK